MKMGYSTVENLHVQTVLFPLLDYCTDISVVNRADTLLEDGLRLWLVTVVSSRLATMGQKLTNASIHIHQYRLLFEASGIAMSFDFLSNHCRISALRSFERILCSIFICFSYYVVS